MSINGANYSALFKYSLLSDQNITTSAGHTCYVIGGDYGTGNGTISGTYKTGNPEIDATPTDQDTAKIALVELGKLVTDIEKTNLPLPFVSLSATYGNTTATFLPNIDYYAVNSSVTFDGTTITFDAQNNLTSQFYIEISKDLSLNNVSMNLANGANPNNIFWLVNNSVTISNINYPIYGNIISKTGSITLNGVGYPVGYSLFSNIFSYFGSIIINTNLEVYGLDAPVPYVVCYAKGTKILTENGYVAIEELSINDKIMTSGRVYKNCGYLENDPEFEPITWLGNFQVNQMSSVSYPILIKANAFGENLPFEDLYVSPAHKFWQMVK